MGQVYTVSNGLCLQAGERLGLTGFPVAEWLPRLNAEKRGLIWVSPIGIADMPVRAEVNAGRWITRCPYCRGASWVDWADPRVWCVDCEHRIVSGRWLSVLFPDEQTRLEGERVLAVRPREEMNWFPDRESTVDLMGENVSMLGLPPFEGW